MNLDEISIKHGTDKSSKAHGYAKKYEKYFNELKDEKLKILEIGVQNGYSLKMWKEYFNNSQIFGVDVVNCSHLNEDRIITLRGSQTDLRFLESINTQFGPFDIIIDDGSHVNNDMLKTLDFMLPLLKDGGLYIVEDLHCCYWPEFTKNTSFMDRIKELLDITNANGKCGLADINNIADDHVYQDKKYGEMTSLEKTIEYIHLYRGIVFIKKY